MSETIDYWPLVVLSVGILTVILQIALFRIHAFIALVLAAILVGLMSPVLAGDQTNAWVAAVETTMREMGVVAGQIAFVIALAAILGMALTKSGAAERIVQQLLRVFGEKYAPTALLVAAFILAIPVFFDTVFFLVIPIAYSLGRRYSEKYTLYILALAIGGVLTHSLAPPTPGPIIMAESLQINLGITIIVGILAGIVPAVGTYLIARRLSKNHEINPPDIGTEETLDPARLPSLVWSILPILVPIALIIAASSLEFIDMNEERTAYVLISFFGNKNIAMLIGTALALWLLARQHQWGLKRLGTVLEKPLELAGVIILITSAGGAFGAMIKNSGISTMIEAMTQEGVAINFVLLAWLISSVLKFAQGSGTVAMITTSAIMAALMPSVDLSFHPIYVYLAIGYGSMTVSWMNDSAFWVVSKLSGFTEQQTLRTWTVMLAVLSVLGLIQTILLSILLPMT